MALCQHFVQELLLGKRQPVLAGEHVIIKASLYKPLTCVLTALSQIQPDSTCDITTNPWFQLLLTRRFPLDIIHINWKVRGKDQQLVQHLSSMSHLLLACLQEVSIILPEQSLDHQGF